MAESKRDKRIWPHIVSGVAGRVAAEIWMSPFNLLKVRLEHDLRLKQLAGRDLPRALLEVVRAEGVRGAWIGLRPRLMWTAPLAAATFTYDSSGQVGGRLVPAARASETQASSFQYRTVVAGPALVAASVALRTPFDIVEQQLQLQRIRAATAAAAAPELVASAAAAPPRRRRASRWPPRCKRCGAPRAGAACGAGTARRTAGSPRTSSATLACTRRRGARCCARRSASTRR